MQALEELSEMMRRLPSVFDEFPKRRQPRRSDENATCPFQAATSAHFLSCQST